MTQKILPRTKNALCKNAEMNITKCETNHSNVPHVNPLVRGSTPIVILIILILAVAVGAGVWWYGEKSNVQQKRQVFKTQEECKKTTGYKCSWGQCDYKCPNNDYWEGWVPINKKIDGKQNQVEGDTSSWQTYRNENLGIEFKYPIQFSVEYVADSNVNKQIIQVRDYEAMISHDIEILENPSRLTSKQYVEKILEDARKEYEGNEGKIPKPYLLSYKEKRELTITDLPAYELYGVFAYDRNEELIYLAKDDLVYFFSFPVAEENPNLPNAIEINKITKQILSTLRFIE